MYDEQAINYDLLEYMVIFTAADKKVRHATLVVISAVILNLLKCL